MAKPNEDPPAVDQETIDMLDTQVKKGKARKFLLIYKGASIKTLVVFKKGPFGPKIMKAKKDGFKGEVAYGVVTGSGKNLFFQLAGNDRVAAAMKVDAVVDKPPTKKAKLREFLAECGLNFKPSYYIITELSEAPDPDVESDIPIPPPSGAEIEDEEEQGSPSNPQSAAAAEPATASNNLSAQFTERLKTFKPDLQRVLTGQTSASQTAKSLAGQAAGHARNQEFEQALQVLDQLEPLIRQGLAELASGPTPAATSDANADRAQKLSTKLKQLKPALDAATQSDPTRKADLQSRMVAIVNAIKSNQLDEAETLMGELVPLLKAQPGRQGVDLAKCRLAWDKTRKQVETELQRLESIILDEFKDTPVAEELKTRIRKLDTILGEHAEKLGDALDAALNSTESEQLLASRREASTVLDQYLAYVANDTFVQEIDSNPFTSVKVKQTLSTTLAALSKIITP